MRRRCAAALFALILAGGNAGSEPSHRPDPKTVAAADNAFGLNLLHALDPDSAANVAISPTSIALVLQIVYNGARGATRQAMSRVLQLGSLKAGDVNFDNLALLASLKDPDSQVKLTIANSLWINLSKHPLLPAFVDINRKYYEAHIGDLAGAPRNVNAWVSKETQGLITQILSEVQENDAAVIANAMYFKGTWSAPFDPARTAAGEFSTSDGTKLVCQMMHEHDTFGYFRGANFEALRLRYGQNKRLSMLILLPDATTSLKAFMVGVNPEALRSWMSQLRPASLQVELPRFTAHYGRSLIESLSTLGMGIAFDQGNADFSGISAATYLSKVEHKAVIQVDESGTTAAAATVAVPTLTSLPHTMAIDHPFFYAVTDEETGALLFIGTLVKPT
jgi:serine protease inhibitor